LSALIGGGGGGGGGVPVRGQFDQVVRPTRGAQFQQGSFPPNQFDSNQGQFGPPGQFRPGQQFDGVHFTQGQFSPEQLQSGHFQQGQFNYPQFQQYPTTPAPGCKRIFNDLSKFY